jgi:hypothetical protein
VAILAVAVLNLIFVAPLRRADLRPGKFFPVAGMRWSNRTRTKRGSPP